MSGELGLLGKLLFEKVPRLCWPKQLLTPSAFCQTSALGHFFPDAGLFINVPQIMWEIVLLFLPSSGGGDVCVGREKECSKPKGARVMKRKESYPSDRRG